jgi:transposase
MPMNAIGVDVSKAWIDVFDPASGAVRRIGNVPSSLQDWARSLTGRFVVFEATGGYDRELGCALAAAGVDYARVNPRQAREFARACGVLAKTDRVDARVLAAMGDRLDLRRSMPSAPGRQRLADLIAYRGSLRDTLTAEQVRLQTVHDPWVRRQVSAAIRTMCLRLKRADAEIERHKHSDESMARLDARLQTAPGVGPQVASTLIACLPELGQVDRRAIASLAGLAPHASESGIRTGRRRIWGGRRSVRRALYMAALVAVRWDDHWKAVYAQMRNSGKAPKTCLIAIARRLLIRLNAMTSKQVDYA